MLLFYIDESGTGLKDKQSPFFVLSATAIPTDVSREVDARVIALKRELVSWAKPEDFEIKGRDLRRGEKFFSNQPWEQRAEAILKVATLLAEVPCKMLAVQVDTRDLPEYVSSDTHLYRLAFWRLLDLIELELAQIEEQGRVLMDARSDLHSSVQDRRAVEAYRDWLGNRSGQTRLIEIPWFGFSAFYAGLQLADFTAYLVDFISNEGTPRKRQGAIEKAFDLIAHKTILVKIP
ncbi:MAG: DUF3800 domain-containing protein [Caldilineaceae bacterium]|nr:DUF3800 domain-containing protein [Caldilineaceae bacterium]